YIFAPWCNSATASWLPRSAPGPPPRTREASGLAQPARPVSVSVNHQRCLVLMLQPSCHTVAVDPFGREHRGEPQEKPADEHHLRGTGQRLPLGVHPERRQDPEPDD